MQLSVKSSSSSMLLKSFGGIERTIDHLGSSWSSTQKTCLACDAKINGFNLLPILEKSTNVNPSSLTFYTILVVNPITLENWNCEHVVIMIPYLINDLIKAKFTKNQVLILRIGNFIVPAKMLTPLFWVMHAISCSLVW